MKVGLNPDEIEIEEHMGGNVYSTNKTHMEAGGQYSLGICLHVFAKTVLKIKEGANKVHMNRQRC
jgi:hypothetical protein